MAKWPKECWQSGQLYQAKVTGDLVFVPTGADRRDVPKECGKLRYLGPARRDAKGYDQTPALF
jgi:hypothetical protein